jgi:hypothetical protein
MATRNTTHILKNSDIVSRPLPSSLLKGEPIVNTADGIVFFSGVTTTTSEWTPAGTGTTSNFFEVGSNLYDLRVRNKITHYNDLTNLSGKFLSGTTNGFELANISDITGVDTFVTGFTYDDVNTFTISRNQGQPNLTSTISVLSGITYYGDGTGLTNIPISGVVNLQTELDSKIENGVNSGGAEEIFSGKSGTDLYFRTLSGGSNTSISTIGDIIRVDVSIPPSTNTFVTGGTYSDVTDTITLTRNDDVTVDITGVTDTFVTGNTLTAANNNTNTQSAQLDYNIPVAGGPYFITTQNTFTTGGTYNLGTTSIDFDKNDGSTFSVDLSNIDVNDTFVTGGTNNSATDNTNSASIDLLYNQDVAPSTYSLPYTDTFTTGGTYNNGTSLITFDQNDGSNFTVDLSTIDVNDTFVTGFTYNSTNNTFTISRNEGEPNLTTSIDTVSGLTISNLTAGRVVYVGTGGELTDESGFEYNDTTNLLTVGDLNVTNSSGTTANIGQGGLVIGSGGSTSTSGVGDLTVHGDLTVFGDTTTISTSELYVEDPQIELNYNPTGDTSTTSVGSGIKIQDGDGTTTGDTYFTIGQMQSLTGIVPGEIPNVSEYSGFVGYNNRGWVTQLNDIVIRNNNLNNGAPNGVRVLAEFDILDGGTY